MSSGIYTHEYVSPLGSILLASDGDALTGLWFEDQRHFDADALKSERRELPIFDETVRWLDLYFLGKVPDSTPKLLAKGTSFREEAWRELLTIPYGETSTYGAIAECMAARRGIPKMSSRAVGGAVGHNPISIIIPCHRVVGSSGSLTGYGGGLQRKIALLEIEGCDLSLFSVPTKGTAL